MANKKLEDFTSLGGIPAAGDTILITDVSDSNATFKVTRANLLGPVGDHNDVDTSGVSDKDVLRYNSSNSQFEAEGLPATLVLAASDETTDLATGTAALTFRMPHAMTLAEVRASVGTAPVGSSIIVDINESGSTILSTKLSIDASEKTSTTAATAPVISDASLADDAEITIDIDQVGSTTAGAGLKVYLIGTIA